MNNESPELDEITFNFLVLEYNDFVFSGTKIKKINIYCPKLINAEQMFLNTELEEIISDFPVLKCGEEMFYNSKKLNKVTTSFPKLVNGYNMFYNCNLDSETIDKILDSLPSWNDDEEHIITFTGCIGAKECNKSIAESKGWVVEI